MLIYIFLLDISRLLDFRKAPLPPIIFKSKNRVDREATHFRHNEFQCKPPQTSHKYNIIKIDRSIVLKNFLQYSRRLKVRRRH